jgi:hypothetical protein
MRELVITLAPNLKGKQLSDALRLVRHFKDAWNRARGLTALVPHLKGKSKARAITQALDAAGHIREKGWCARALANLVPHLDGDTKARVLADALQGALVDMEAYWDDDGKAEALSSVGQHLDQEQLADVMAAVRNIERDKERAWALADLAPYLYGDQVAEALADAEAISDEKSRNHALSALAPFLAYVPEVRVLSAIQTIADTRKCTEVLLAIPFHVGRKNWMRRTRLCLLNQLEKCLSRGTQAEALEIVSILRTPVVGKKTIASLLGHISEILDRWRFAVWS